MFPVRTVDIKDLPETGKANNESFTKRADAKNANTRDDDSGDAFADHMQKDESPESNEPLARESDGSEPPGNTGEATKPNESAPEEAPIQDRRRMASHEGKSFAAPHAPAPLDKTITFESGESLNTEALLTKDVSAKTHIAVNPAGEADAAKAPTLAQTASQSAEVSKVTVAKASAPVVKEVVTNRAGVAKAAAGVHSNTVSAENKSQAAAPVAQLSGALSAQDGIVFDGVPPVEEDALPKDLTKKDLLGARAAAAAKPTAQNTNNIAAGASAQTAISPLSESVSEFGSQLFTQESAASAKIVNLQPSQIATSVAQTSSAAAASTASAQLVAAIRTEPKSGDIELRLDPPELGRVRINLSVETADAVKAVLTVERPETLEHLRRNMNQFTEDLRAAGFESIDVEFSEGGGSDFDDEPAWAGTASDMTASAEIAPKDVIYLSLRDNAQLDLLV